MVTITESTRETSYQPTTPTTAFPVGFPLFDNDDLLVVANGEIITAYTVSGTYVEGISTDAVVNISGPGVTGDVSVKGNRAPRRTDQYKNGAPLKIQDHNYSLNRIEATLQELRRDADEGGRGLAQEIIERKAADEAEQAARILADEQERSERIQADASEASTRALADEQERQARIDGDHNLQVQIDIVNSELDQFDSKVARAEAAATSAEASEAVVHDLLDAAVSGFQGFEDGLGYDFGFITQPLTYFDRDFGSIADPVTN